MIFHPSFCQKNFRFQQVIQKMNTHDNNYENDGWNQKWIIISQRVQLINWMKLRKPMNNPFDKHSSICMKMKSNRNRLDIFIYKWWKYSNQLSRLKLIQTEKISFISIHLFMQKNICHHWSSVKKYARFNCHTIFPNAK